MIYSVNFGMRSKRQRGRVEMRFWETRLSGNPGKNAPALFEKQRDHFK